VTQPPPEVTPSPPPAGPPDLAEQLQPDLELIRPLGRGSTADVFLARETGLRRLVAVKVLRQELAADETVRRRFVREAQSAARVHHANVTTVYRIGELSGALPYIVMEYIDGRTVRDVLDTVGPYGEGEARALLTAIASALAAVHAGGVVHRDVQPGNVYIERSGRAVLGDFGIAALVESGSDTATRLTQAGVRLGDTRYMSPEQLRGERPTECTDVYSFGILAYELLTGRGPYEASRQTELLVAHIREAPTPLSRLLPGIDVNLARLIELCLAKEPNRRPRAADLAARLDPQAGALAAGGAEERGRVAEFLAELQRRRVYQVLMWYGAVTAAVFGTAQVVYDAFELSQRSYQFVVLLTLGGFPVALVLSWLYDITGGGIQRTASTPTSRRIRSLKWIGLGASVVSAALIGWILLR
jgi:eukaryotic-like serine/threonine-protein kinase